MFSGGGKHEQNMGKTSRKTWQNMRENMAKHAGKHWKTCGKHWKTSGTTLRNAAKGHVVTYRRV